MGIIIRNDEYFSEERLKRSLLSKLTMFADNMSKNFNQNITAEIGKKCFDEAGCSSTVVIKRHVGVKHRLFRQPVNEYAILTVIETEIYSLWGEGSRGIIVDCYDKMIEPGLMDILSDVEKEEKLTHIEFTRHGYMPVTGNENFLIDIGKTDATALQPFTV